jgi:hypothetical protein
MEEVLNIYLSTAHDAYQQKEYRIAEIFLKRAVKEARRIGRKCDVVATILENVALMQSKQGKTMTAARLYKHILEVFERYEQSASIARISYKLADLYFGIGYHHRVEQYLKKAFALEPTKTPNKSRVRQLILVLEVQGKGSDARQFAPLLRADSQLGDIDFSVPEPQFKITPVPSPTSRIPQKADVARARVVAQTTEAAQTSEITGMSDIAQSTEVAS